MPAQNPLKKIWIGEWKDEERYPIWHEELKSTRRTVAKEWTRTTLIICAFILAVLSLFGGTFFHVQQNLGSLVVWVVDFDGQVPPYKNEAEPYLVGPLVVRAAEKIVQSSKPHVGFGVLPASDFNYSTDEVRRRIYDFDAWAAIVINPNATALLRSAIATGNSSYDPAGAHQTIYVEARDTVATDTYMIPELEAFQNSAVTVGLIYLIILAFFSFAFFMPTHTHFVNQMEGHRRLYFGHLFIWKYLSTVGAYFFMSLAYSLVPLAFQVPFSNPPASHIEVAVNANAFGSGSFPVFWMLNFVGMCALGLACENVAMFIGLPYTAFWLIFWVISNVCTSFYPIELSPALYYYGYAFPLHQIVEATKTILFDVNSRIGLHFGILFAWWAVNTAFFPSAAYWLRMEHLAKMKKRDLLGLVVKKN